MDDADVGKIVDNITWQLILCGVMYKHWLQPEKALRLGDSKPNDVIHEE